MRINGENRTDGTSQTSMITDVKAYQPFCRTGGPFANTKQQLGGIYVVDVKDLNEAVTWASMIPDARTGSIEIRPLMNIPEI